MKIYNKLILKSKRGTLDSGYRDANVSRWMQKVNWCKGDLNDPVLIENYIKTFSAVVYSVGILLENRYKRFLSGKDHLFSFFLPSRDEDLSYDKINRDFGNFLKKKVCLTHINV